MCVYWIWMHINGKHIFHCLLRSHFACTSPFLLFLILCISPLRPPFPPTQRISQYTFCCCECVCVCGCVKNINAMEKCKAHPYDMITNQLTRHYDLLSNKWRKIILPRSIRCVIFFLLSSTLCTSFVCCVVISAALFSIHFDTAAQDVHAYNMCVPLAAPLTCL